MLFNVALFSSLLLIPVVLAFPSELGAAFARRQSGVTSTLNAAGAMYIQDNATFTNVTGTFTVPTPSGVAGESTSIWVGIDDATCTNSAFQVGIILITGSSGPTIGAWCQFHPSGPQNLSVIDISPGDLITLNIVTWSTTSGTATINNYSNGESVSATLISSSPLCGRDVEWVVQGTTENSVTIPLANFGTVLFTEVAATGPSGTTYGPGNATVIEFSRNNTVLTNVSTNETSILIQYI